MKAETEIESPLLIVIEMDPLLKLVISGISLMKMVAVTGPENVTGQVPKASTKNSQPAPLKH